MDVEAKPSPGELIREARRRAQLSQNDLALRARVAQSAVSAYESGRRTPTLATLERLLSAAGHRLVLDSRRDDVTPSGLPDTPLGRRLRQRRRAIRDCAQRHGARNIRVFGSVARGEENSQSDIDFVVDVPARTGLLALEALRRELSDIVGVEVDVSPLDNLRKEVRIEVERDAVTL
jgi:uncharacterized protein